MSEQKHNTASYQQAYNELMTNVYSPVFFTKLAQYGIVPQDAEEADYFVQLAGRLRQEAATHQTKIASDRKSILKAALGKQASDTAVETQCKEAAVTLVNTNPAVKEAALLYRDYLAQALAAGNM